MKYYGLNYLVPIIAEIFFCSLGLLEYDILNYFLLVFWSIWDFLLMPGYLLFLNWDKIISNRILSIVAYFNMIFSILVQIFLDILVIKLKYGVWPEEPPVDTPMDLYITKFMVLVFMISFGVIILKYIIKNK